MDVRSLDLGESSTGQSEPFEVPLAYEAHLSTSFVPSIYYTAKESVSLWQSLQDLQSGSSHSLMWPTIGGAPINEFTTEGYFSMVFPPCSPQKLPMYTV